MMIEWSETVPPSVDHRAARRTRRAAVGASARFQTARRVRQEQELEKKRERETAEPDLSGDLADRTEEDEAKDGVKVEEGDDKAEEDDDVKIED